ncbi:MAG: host-nuclease inhibitor Gam family protein [Zoogloeaceae bacterium]|jgi:phage host-nuclease inhibitor protein Gam|nr:host-nuclease inhibitor Gam family protein [Zoogloeaceae bacterium]
MVKAKKTAATYVCQSKDETMTAIKELGDCQRSLTRIKTRLNDLIAEKTAEVQGDIDTLSTRIETLTAGIAGWCEANRATLCADGRKSANLITGEVSWRQRPPSVFVRQVDKVIDLLAQLGKTRFLREKQEVNKEAILAEPQEVVGIPGITVVTGIEDFAVTPFEVELAEES